MAEKRRFHYVYTVYTDNLCWGRLKLGTYPTRSWANREKEQWSRTRGCCIVKKEREYEAA